MICPKCGAESDGKFCANCGAPLEQPIAAEQPKETKNKKMTTCKSCGQPVAKNAKTCPHCGAKVKRRHPILGTILAIIVLFIIIAAVTPSEPSSPESTETPVTSAPVTPLVDNDFVTVTYEKVFDSDLTEGALYFVLDVDNNSSYTEFISLQNCAVNNSMVFCGTGVPITITPGNSSSASFIFTNPPVSKAEDVETVQFQFVVYDNDHITTELYRSEIMTVTVNQ